MCHAGEQPWPHYWSHPPEDAFRSLWVLEGEGEKVADYAASAGFVCISHPGHNRTDEAILRRYRELKEMVAGVVYLADADRQGAALGRRLKDAATFVGLPFIGIDMGVAFPDLPKGGSLDDVPDVGAAIQQILAGVNEDHQRNNRRKKIALNRPAQPHQPIPRIHQQKHRYGKSTTDERR